MDADEEITIFYRRDRKARRDSFMFFLCGLRVLGGEYNAKVKEKKKWQDL
jgi:hypothetical protein